MGILGTLFGRNFFGRVFVLLVVLCFPFLILFIFRVHCSIFHYFSFIIVGYLILLGGVCALGGVVVLIGLFFRLFGTVV